MDKFTVYYSSCGIGNGKFRQYCTENTKKKYFLIITTSLNKPGICELRFYNQTNRSYHSSVYTHILMYLNILQDLRYFLTDLLIAFPLPQKVSPSNLYLPALVYVSFNAAPVTLVVQNKHVILIYLSNCRLLSPFFRASLHFACLFVIQYQFSQGRTRRSLHIWSPAVKSRVGNV